MACSPRAQTNQTGSIRSLNRFLIAPEGDMRRAQIPAAIVSRSPKTERHPTIGTYVPWRRTRLRSFLITIPDTARRTKMSKRIAIVGVGAVGGYTGAHMVRACEDVTFIDFWPAHVDEMSRNGLRITHHQGEEPFTVKVHALHLTEAQHLSKEAPIDIAFVCTKSYDTHWAALLIHQYLAPGGFVVSLQNCMNEATIAGVVGWGKTMGCIASNISVGLVEPGHVHRGGVKGGAAHTVYRIGEVHGTITDRAHEICRLVSHADSAKVNPEVAPVARVAPPAAAPDTGAARSRRRGGIHRDEIATCRCYLRTRSRR